MLGVGEGSRPFLEYVLFNVEKAGYESVVLVVPQNDNSIRDHYEYRGAAAQFPRLHISYVPQEVPSNRTKPLGTADALLQALRATPQWRGERFTVCNSDNLYSQHALEILLHDDHDNALIAYNRSALQFSEERIAQFAVIKTSAAGFLSDIMEKPSAEELEQARDESGRVCVSMNIWRFSYDLILPHLEEVPLHPVRQEKELPSAVKLMVYQHPSSVFAIVRAEHVIDLTSQSDIPAVAEYLEKNFSQSERRTP
jgi:glucose-1-phosphate adenylyltransferase